MNIGAKSPKLRPGDRVAARGLHTITGAPVRIPDPRRRIHLQFRRFAGCPVCNLHLSSIVRRHAEIEAANIREVVVFHSTAKDLLVHADQFPFDVLADPGKRLYAEFGVEASVRALLDPRSWTFIAAGVVRSALAITALGAPAPSMHPPGGSLGLPADFLLASDGSVLECKYGHHAYDQWSVDELLDLNQSLSPRSARALDMAFTRPIEPRK
jgi:peroxiredoxin